MDETLLSQHVRTTSAICPDCGYTLTGLASDRCPECGATLRLVVATGRPQPDSISASFVLVWLVAFHCCSMAIDLWFDWLMYEPIRNMARSLGQPVIDGFPAFVWQGLTDSGAESFLQLSRAALAVIAGGWLIRLRFRRGPRTALWTRRVGVTSLVLTLVAVLVYALL